MSINISTALDYIVVYTHTLYESRLFFLYIWSSQESNAFIHASIVKKVYSHESEGSRVVQSEIHLILKAKSLASAWDLCAVPSSLLFEAQNYFFS